MADSSYDAEVSGIQAFLSMQHHKGDSTPMSPGQVNTIFKQGLVVQSPISANPGSILYVLLSRVTCNTGLVLIEI